MSWPAIDWSAEPLGKASDYSIAGRLGCSTDRVRRNRRKLGIGPYRDSTHTMKFPLRVMVIEKLGRFSHQSTRDIHRRVSADWGSVSVQTIRTRLVELESEGKVERLRVGRNVGWRLIPTSTQ